MSDSERISRLAARVENLELRLEASERRQAQVIESVAIELARIREECGVPPLPTEN